MQGTLVSTDLPCDPAQRCGVDDVGVFEGTDPCLHGTEADRDRRTVYEAAQERLALIFSEFDNVYVSFSGGKDSGVLLNLAIDYLREHYPGRRLGVMHIDYEAQYQMTTDYVDQVVTSNLDILDIYRVCLPIAAECSTSMTKPHWIPWEAAKRDIWVRQLPTHDGVIHEGNHTFPWFLEGMQDYELQERFTGWIHQKNKATKTACLVGIRTQESQNRWHAIHGKNRIETSKFKDINWTTEIRPHAYNCYPIYDWKVEDVWTANAKFGWSYNKLYDLFYMAGIPLGKQRVASPFNHCAMESLKLYKVIDPNNWGKMVGRTDGVNFAGLYGGTTAMGWKTIKLPDGYTWKQYMEFLLFTLPQEVSDSYKKKLEFSRCFWRTKGGSLSPETVQLLKDQGIAMTVGAVANNHTVFKENLPVIMEYLDDIDVPDFRLMPTYKRMCIAIMKNDLNCKTLGFGQNKAEMALRKNAAVKYADIYTDAKAHQWIEGDKE